MIQVTIPTLPEHLSVLLLEFDDKGYYTYPSGAPECTVTKSLAVNIMFNIADDCLLYRDIRTQQDHTILQEDLQNLEVWARVHSWFLVEFVLLDL